MNSQTNTIIAIQQERESLLRRVCTLHNDYGSSNENAMRNVIDRAVIELGMLCGAQVFGSVIGLPGSMVEEFKSERLFWSLILTHVVFISGRFRLETVTRTIKNCVDFNNTSVIKR